MPIPRNQLPKHVIDRIDGAPAKPHKYGVSAASGRTWNGRTYASKAEAEYAALLYGRRDRGDILEVIEQPRFTLGCPENVYRPDFLVIQDRSFNHLTYTVDVKGAETPAFRKNKKLWARYGRIPLVIVRKSRRKGGGFDVAEVVGGGAA